MIRRIMTALLALTLAVSIAACGKRSDLEPPPGKKSEYPRMYPR